MKNNSLFGIIMLAMLTLTFGCSATSSTPLKQEATTEVHVEKDLVEELDINLEIDYGIVDISTGTSDFVVGDITYNFAELEPNVKYKYRRKSGRVTIDQPKIRKTKMKKGQLKNKWDLQLTNDIPVVLKVDTGASETNMDLRGMQLRTLDMEAGVGSTTIHLGGQWQDNVDVDLDMGVGQTTIILPKDVGVKVKAEKGIGTTNFKGLQSDGDGVYVNKAYESADVTITVNANLGIGEANFELEK